MAKMKDTDSREIVHTITSPRLEHDTNASVDDADEHATNTRFAAYQRAIYLNGCRGIMPIMTTNPNLWESAAKHAMRPEAFAYLKGGAGSGATIDKNFEAFEKWSIVPRMVRANTERSLKVTVFGEEWPAPVAMAPVGVNKVFHP